VAIPLAEVNKVDAERRLAEAEAAYEAADKSDIATEDEAQDAVQSARAMVEAAS
jgi:F-type H+-transporting ATPase subunit epsilon